jgi:hypothetical protein
LTLHHLWLGLGLESGFLNFIKVRVRVRDRVRVRVRVRVRPSDPPFSSFDTSSPMVRVRVRVWVRLSEFL